jgi:hypothetical protein
MNYKEYQDPLYERFQKRHRDYNELNQYRSMFSFNILPINKRFRYIHNVNTWEEFDAFFLEELTEIDESIKLLVKKEESDKLSLKESDKMLVKKESDNLSLKESDKLSLKESDKMLAKKESDNLSLKESDKLSLKESDNSPSILRTFLQKKQNIQKYNNEANNIFELIKSKKDYYIKCYEYLKQNKMNDDFETDEKWEAISKYGKLKLIDIPLMITRYDITQESEYYETKKKIYSLQKHLNEIHKEMEAVINTAHMEHIERIKRYMIKYFKSANCPYEVCIEKIDSYMEGCPHCNQKIILKFNEDIICINDTPANIIYYFEKQE